MRRTVICTILLILLLSSSPLLALDKRVAIHNPLPNELVVKLNSVYTTQRVDQYNVNNQRVNSIENTSVALKTQFFYSPAEKYSLALESIYLVDRNQKTTHANGQTTKALDSSGLGDTSLQLYFEPYDSRKQKFGLLLGGEVMLPTGDADKGLGTGSTDFSLRSTLSLKTDYGFPYFATIYTWAGRGKINSEETEEADDLFLALGHKSRYWHSFAFNVRGFIYLLQNDAHKHNDGNVIVSKKHKVPGYRCELFYAVSQKIEASLFVEQSWPEEHGLTLNSTPMTSKPGRRDRGGLTLRVNW